MGKYWVEGRFFIGSTKIVQLISGQKTSVGVNIQYGNTGTRIQVSCELNVVTVSRLFTNYVPGTSITGRKGRK